LGLLLGGVCLALSSLTGCNAPASVQKAALKQEAAAKELAAAWEDYAEGRAELVRYIAADTELGRFRAGEAAAPSKKGYWEEKRKAVITAPLGHGDYLLPNLKNLHKANQLSYATVQLLLEEVAVYSTLFREYVHVEIDLVTEDADEFAKSLQELAAASGGE
tara:strand:+ start:1732 stop:2217 length:486 start_codon:yes stop_codon:yes gene_type:complete